MPSFGQEPLLAQEQVSGFGLGRPTGSDTAGVRGLAHDVQSPRTACHTLWFLRAGPQRVKDQAMMSHPSHDPYVFFLKTGCQTVLGKAKRLHCEGNERKKETGGEKWKKKRKEQQVKKKDRRERVKSVIISKALLTVWVLLQSLCFKFDQWPIKKISWAT